MKRMAATRCVYSLVSTLPPPPTHPHPPALFLPLIVVVVAWHLHFAWFSQQLDGTATAAWQPLSIDVVFKHLFESIDHKFDLLENIRERARKLFSRDGNSLVMEYQHTKSWLTALRVKMEIEKKVVVEVDWTPDLKTSDRHVSAHITCVNDAFVAKTGEGDHVFETIDEAEKKIQRGVRRVERDCLQKQIRTWISGSNTPVIAKSWPSTVEEFIQGKYKRASTDKDVVAKFVEVLAWVQFHLRRKLYERSHPNEPEPSPPKAKRG